MKFDLWRFRFNLKFLKDKVSSKWPSVHRHSARRAAVQDHMSRHQVSKSVVELRSDESLFAWVDLMTPSRDNSSLGPGTNERWQVGSVVGVVMQ